MCLASMCHAVSVWTLRRNLFFRCTHKSEYQLAVLAAVFVACIAAALQSYG